MSSTQDKPSVPARTNPLHPLEDYLASLLGVSREDRQRLLQGMMRRPASDAASYWLQLSLSGCIATLGLVLNSSAVVIGAMLIAPLMGPIVELAMALAIGSPYLAVRSLLRVAFSVLLVVGGAAGIELALPFHELTSEIGARTSPTVLDLIVAACCALTAAFSTVRSGAETASTAAGTAIGISLVPPLGAMGIGLGLRQWAVAKGAALLFTSNFCAILLFAGVFFFLLGFESVRVEEIEYERGQSATFVGRVAQWLQRQLGLRYSWLFRIILPGVLLAAVYAPLSRALTEVGWQARTHQQVTHILAELVPANRSLQTSLVVERHQVILHLVLTAPPEQARQLEQRIRSGIEAVAGVTPVVHVMTVADMEALGQVARELHSLPPPSPVVVQHSEDLVVLHSRLQSALNENWPKSVGPLLAWNLSWRGNDLGISVRHLGAPLGAVAEPLLARLISDKLEKHVFLTDEPIAPGPHRAALLEWRDWVPRLAVAAASVASVPTLRMCLELPSLPPEPKKPDPHRTATVMALEAAHSLVAGLGERAVMSEGATELQFWLTDGSCSLPGPPAAIVDPSTRPGAGPAQVPAPLRSGPSVPKATPLGRSP